MRYFALSFIVWYFAVANGAGVGRVVGPFVDKGECQKLKLQFASVNVMSTDCWEVR